DSLYVNGVKLAPSGQEDWQRWIYQASLEQATVYEFTFERPNRGNYASTTTAPPEVVVMAPEEGAVLSRASGFAIAWAPDEGNTIALDIDEDFEQAEAEGMQSGYCCLYLSDEETEQLAFEIADTGSHDVSPNGLQNAQQVYGVSPAECPNELPAVITLERKRVGTLHPGLSGEIGGNAKAIVHFRSIP
ncbi:MAG: hypothetical protein NTZ09_19615, partial [Candidatus Hydrogenedentes bacterium]|nr:hypothetical protein [Candidatus Hydrogenedentota bacterium]